MSFGLLIALSHRKNGVWERQSNRRAGGGLDLSKVIGRCDSSHFGKLSRRMLLEILSDQAVKVTEIALLKGGRGRDLGAIVTSVTCGHRGSAPTMQALWH